MAGQGTPVHSTRIGGPTSHQRELPIEMGVKSVIWNEYSCALADMLGVCKFVYGVFSSSWEIQQQKVEKLIDLFSAATGRKTSREEIWCLTERLHNLERSFDTREGLGKPDDDMPWRFVEEPLPEGPCKGNTYTNAQATIEEYYRQRKWDVKTGMSTWELLENSGLYDVAEDLKDLGIIGEP